MSSSKHGLLTSIQASQETGEIVWYSHLLKNFPQITVIHTVKGFGIVNEAEVDAFLELWNFSPWVERSSGEGNGYPFQYSCLENSMDRKTCWAAVHGVTKWSLFVTP